MHQPILSAVAAIQSSDRGIGYQNTLLYRIRSDLKWFKELTTGHVIIMGRKTFDSIGKPLPNRTTIVITRNKGWQHAGVVVAESIDEAIKKAKEIEKKEIFVIGGAEIYAQSMPYLDRLYLTVVEGDKDADTFFPPYQSAFTKMIEQSQKSTDPQIGAEYYHLMLERA